MVRFLSTKLQHYEPDKDAPQLQVIGLGLPRCGTSSFQIALEILGYDPCMHFAHIMPSVKRINMIRAAFEEDDKVKRQAILREFYHGFAASSDHPGPLFAEDLMEMYPDAKIVLGLRKDADAWWRSYSGNILFFFSRLHNIITYLVPTSRAGTLQFQAAGQYSLKQYSVSMFSKEWYDVHNDWLRKIAKKKGRPVLEFQAQDGWEPLCKFLGKEVPDEPYPRINDKAAMDMLKKIVVARGLLYWAGLLVALGLAARVLFFVVSLATASGGHHEL